MSRRILFALFVVLTSGAITVTYIRSRSAASDLPESYLGRWHAIDISGGIAGELIPAAPGTTIVVRATMIEQHAADGTLTSATPFELTRGPSIFGEKRARLLNAAGTSPQTIELTPTDVLTISDNVYDGFSRRYRREP